MMMMMIMVVSSEENFLKLILIFPDISRNLLTCVNKLFSSPTLQSDAVN